MDTNILVSALLAPAFLPAHLLALRCKSRFDVLILPSFHGGRINAGVARTQLEAA